MSASFWSGDAIKAERRDIHAASCMAVSRCGRHALLASRRQVALVDLQRPSERLRTLSMQSKYDAGTAAWSRVPDTAADCAAVTYNTQVSVLRCSESELVQAGLLQSHRRSITDLDWHWSEPLLATCSVDTAVHIWDLRESRRPVATMCSVESVCQVKWNRLSSQTLASAHEGDIRVWDRRKLNIPERYISAHTAKIHGLDWSPTLEHQLVTASQDMYVKFIDVTNPRSIVSMAKARDPVWRARFTPFGTGLVTVAVPQLRRGDNYTLCLWNTASLGAAVHTFSGHTDVVLEFDWCSWQPTAATDSGDFRLVTWSRDQTLRLWPMKPELLQACGYEAVPASAATDAEHAASPTTDGSCLETSCLDTTGSQDQSAAESGPASPPYSPVRPPPRIRRALSEGPPPTPTQPRTLEQEFRMINKNIDNVCIEKLNVGERCCHVSVLCGTLSAFLRVDFPLSYPATVPELRFLEGTRLSAGCRQDVKKSWLLMAEQHVKRNRSCLEPCLRNLAACVRQLSQQSEESAPALYPSSTAVFPSANIYGSFKDVNVAFPRTSGARFCGNGTLVVFACPAYMKRLSSRGDSVTPRSLSALDAYLKNFAQGALALSMVGGSPLLYPAMSRSPTAADSSSLIFSKDVRLGTASLGRRGKGYGEEGRARPRHHRPHTNLVLCFDVQPLLPLSRELGEKYVLDMTDFAGMCSTNASLAASVGRKDLEKVWNLVALVGDPLLVAASPDPNAGRPWAQHPFGRKLVNSVISHYLRQRDVQTVAMLCCVFGQKTEPPSGGRHQPPPPLDNSSPGESPYHTVHPTETRRAPTLESLGVTLTRQNRSSSWSDVLDESRLQSADTAALEHRLQHLNNCRILDPARQPEFDRYKHIYANMLYKWRLTSQRAQVLKYAAAVPPPHRGLEVRAECARCGRLTASAECLHCRRSAVTCVICHVSVRGMSAFCMLCGHGGHLLHLKQWFSSHAQCPAGCRCSCLEAFAQTLQE